MKIIAVLLNPTIDEIFEIDNFHVEGTFKVKKKSTYPVGKAISIALGIQELTDKNDNIKVIAFIGQSEITSYSQFLQIHKIDFEYVLINGQTRSNKTINDPIKKTTTHIRSIGFNVTESDFQKLNDLILNNLENGDFIVFSVSIPPGAPEDIYFNLINECKSRGVTTILDSSDNALIQGIKAGPMIIKPNLEELAQIMNINFMSNLIESNLEEDLVKIVNNAKTLLNNGIKIILITLGDKGALCLTKNESLHGIIKLENAHDTVGSGDSFLAGFITKYAFNEDIINCFKNAIACGAANTLLPGPGFFQQGVVNSLIKDVRINLIN